MITSFTYRGLGACSLNTSETVASQGRKPTTMVLSVNCGQHPALWFGEQTHFFLLELPGKVGELCGIGAMGICGFIADGDVRWLHRLSGQVKWL